MQILQILFIFALMLIDIRVYVFSILGLIDIITMDFIIAMVLTNFKPLINV